MELRRCKMSRKTRVMITFLFLAAAVGLAGCGGGGYYSGSSSTPSHPPSITQKINYTMPPGAISTSTVSYASSLNEGEHVTGFIRLTGTCPSMDWDSTCCFKVFDPYTNAICNWCSDFGEGGLRHDFSFTTSYSGEYILQVQHGSNYQRKLHIEIQPAGWRKT